MFFSPRNINKVNSFQPTNPYKLIEKSENRNVANFSEEHVSVPENAETYSKIVIGKNADASYRQEIYSFYDKDKKLIKRFFTDNNNSKKVRTYAYTQSSTINFDPVNIREIQTKEYVEPSINNNFSRWKILSDETQITEKTQKPDKVLIHKTSYKDKFETPKSKASSITAEISEYYAPRRFRPNLQPKRLIVELKNETGVPEVEKIITQNINQPKNHDKFLAYRLLSGAQKQEALTAHYLKERGLGEVGIKIETNPQKVPSKAIASFDSRNGAIYFKEILDNPAGIAAHEAEHAYQHKLIGQSGEGRSTYEKKCREKYGQLSHPCDIEEAKKCKAASDFYPGGYLVNDFDISLYKNNYLEIKSNEVEEKAEKEYNQMKRFWTDQFKLSQKRNWF